MRGFVVVAKRAKGGQLYVDIPTELIKKMNLKPFMAGKISVKNNSIVLSDFQKTVKIKVDLDKKTIEMAKQVMKEEGYGSLDETISNIVSWFATKRKAHVVYFYPEQYLRKGYFLIDDFENWLKNEKKR